jgi:hypothetical protein
MQTKLAHIIGFVGALAFWAGPAGLVLAAFGPLTALLCVFAGVAAIAVAAGALAGEASPALNLAAAGNKPGRAAR